MDTPPILPPEDPSSLGEGATGRVLVLNRNWQAVNIIGMRRAFALLWQEHARVINTFDGDFAPLTAGEWIEFSMRPGEPPKGAEYVRTIRLHIILPKILLLRDYDRLPIAEVKFNRQNVFERDNYTCQYTGRVCRPKAPQRLDHVMTRALPAESRHSTPQARTACGSRKRPFIPAAACTQAAKVRRAGQCCR